MNPRMTVGVVVTCITLFTATMLLHAQATQPAAQQARGEKGKEWTTPGGVTVVTTRAAEGARNGDAIFVHYVGKLTDGTQFNSSYESGQPVSLLLGAGEVIAGWEEGLQGMQVGEKRTITIPPKLAYGDKGAGEGKIPPNATLVFELELMALQRK